MGVLYSIVPAFFLPDVTQVFVKIYGAPIGSITFLLVLIVMFALNMSSVNEGDLL